MSLGKTTYAFLRFQAFIEFYRFHTLQTHYLSTLQQSGNEHEIPATYSNDDGQKAVDKIEFKLRKAENPWKPRRHRPRRAGNIDEEDVKTEVNSEDV